MDLFLSLSLILVSLGANLVIVGLRSTKQNARENLNEHIIWLSEHTLLSEPSFLRKKEIFLFASTLFLPRVPFIFFFLLKSIFLLYKTYLFFPETLVFSNFDRLLNSNMPRSHKLRPVPSLKSWQRVLCPARQPWRRYPRLASHMQCPYHRDP